MKHFFDTVRPLFGGKMSQSQVEGCKYILSATAGLPEPFRAYLLATAYHETAHTMEPIRERGGNAYFKRMYDKAGNRPHVAERLGNTDIGDGVKFHGRGYVQITGRTNYRRASKKLGVDFLAKPDKVMVPSHAAKILVAGCVEGWFTGKRLGDYLLGANPDYKNARRVVNGIDRAADIAGYAKVFEAALEKPLEPPKPSPFAGIIKAILSIFGGSK